MTSHAEQVGCDSRTRLPLHGFWGQVYSREPCMGLSGPGSWELLTHLSASVAGTSGPPVLSLGLWQQHTHLSPSPRSQALAGASLGPRTALGQGHLVQPWQDRWPMQTDMGSRQPAPGLQPEDPAFLLPPGQKVREAQRANCWRGAIGKPRTKASGGSRPGSTRTTEFHGATDVGATSFRGLSQAVQAAESCYGGPCDFQGERDFKRFSLMKPWS